MLRALLPVAFLLTPLCAEQFQYVVLATTKTSTMEKEMNDAAQAGYSFSAVMGGDTATAGNQVVVIMAKGAESGRMSYRLLATNKTSTMQKELQALGDEGYEYRGQTVFESTFGGKQVCVILERKPEGKRIEYRLLATAKTSTMEKELLGAGMQGFRLVGMTVGQTAFGGNELLSILVRSSD
jgi:hypothetical protein